MSLHNYRPQQSCKGYVFTPVCLSTWGDLPQCMLGYHPLGADLPPGAGTPPIAGTPPPADEEGCGRYASYWNAFLLVS